MILFKRSHPESHPLVFLRTITSLMGMYEKRECGTHAIGDQPSVQNFRGPDFFLSPQKTSGNYPISKGFFIFGKLLVHAHGKDSFERTLNGIEFLSDLARRPRSELLHFYCDRDYLHAHRLLLSCNFSPRRSKGTTSWRSTIPGVADAQ